EPFAVPDREINLGTTRLPENLYLELSPPLSIQPKIVSAIVTADGLIKMRLNTKLQLDYLKENTGAIRFISASDSNKVYYARAFLESHLDTSSILTVYSQKIDSGKYSVSLQSDSATPPIIYDGLSVGEIKDKNLPLVLEFIPKDKQVFKKDAKLELLFNEPIDTAKTTTGTFSLKLDTLTSLNLVPRWSDPFHASLETSNLEEGGRYTLSLAEFEISDLAGNLLGDSIFTYEFIIISSDSLGSASGVVLVELAKKENAAKHLTFTNVQTKQTFDLKVTGNNFSTDLPAGKYLLSGFLDENGNAIRDVGSVRPNTFAETFSKSSDTISVRARFETAGIEFKFK
ncbi:MAG TPA: Ig-like domain-containing protein, partial [candidate division Zixibacteria bacterium]|nr:Ig-like domain-containing protein [candidate division Zixibacteria bacterium]